MRSPTWSRDELLLAGALVVENGWRELRETDPRVRELSDLLRSLPLHGNARVEAEQFRSVGSVSRKTTDLATNHPAYTGARTRCGKGDHAVINDFIQHREELLQATAAIRAGMESGELHRIPRHEEEEDQDGVTAFEGKLLARWAIHRERSPKLRRRKIEQAKRLGKGLECSVCNFHFERTYGRLGEGYIEVHHVLPLHLAGPRETKLEDLALLCANCHRMCHRSHLGTSWRRPEALRADIAAARHAAQL